MIIIEKDSLDEIYMDVFDRLVEGKPKGSIDIQIRPSVFSYNNLYRSRTCNYDFDLGLVGLTPTRWPRLVNDYIDRTRFANWLPKVKKLGRGRELLFPFKEVVPVQRKKMSNYNYGACLLGLTFRLYPPKVTLFSRATNWSQIGALDLALARAFAWHISDYMGNVELDEIEFSWLNSSTYLMPITAIAWMVSSGKFADIVESDYKVSQDIRNLMKYYTEIENPAYSPIKRIRKRVAYILDGRHQQTPVQEFRLFTPREWSKIKEKDVDPSEDLGKLRGGYLKTQKYPGGPLFHAGTYDIVREVKRRKASLERLRNHDSNILELPRRKERDSERSVRTGRSASR